MRVQFGAGADRLTWVYAKLSPQLKKCAAYILEHPSEVATLSMRQVAANADVPWSTLTRLAHAAGFGAYSELRDVYLASINNASAARPHRAGQLQTAIGESDIGYTLNIFQRVTLLNISTLFDDIDTDALDRAARALTAARSVLVAGTQESHSLANYFHCVAAMGFRNWHLVTRHNGEYTHLFESVTGADVFVGISFEPWAAETIRVARHARERGARVIGITDRRTSPLASCSHDILLVPIQSPSFFQSYVATTALIEILLGMVVARGGASVVENIERLERYRREMDEYWQE
ncbi:MAG: MurR/RpiR family transcriptional regulator [Thiotrichales bacterium]|nr:MurR/RpiR family transcriptional regulator [Thiotrichales bacterium]